jgi:hypothetical protein
VIAQLARASLLRDEHWPKKFVFAVVFCPKFIFLRFPPKKRMSSPEIA